MSVSASRRVVIPAGSTAGTGVPIDRSQFELLSYYLTSTGTTSGGTILIEEADWDPDTESIYTGTWSQIASIAASSFTGGAQVAYHVGPFAQAFVRARISSAITGGGSIQVVERTK